MRSGLCDGVGWTGGGTVGGEEVRARPSAGGGDVRVSWQTVGEASPAGAWRLILL